MKLPKFTYLINKSIISNMFNPFRQIAVLPFVSGLLTVVLPSLIILMYYLNSYVDKLEVVNVITQIIVAVAALLAFVNYFENISERKSKEAVELVSFFRDKIISTQTDVTKLIKKEKGSNYTFIKLQSFNPSSIESEFVKLSKDDFNKMASVSNIEEVYYLQLLLLNHLEEFALRVRLNSLETHKALFCVRYAFVEIVEINAYVISFQRTFGTSAVLYSELLGLYSNLEKLIDRQSPESRFEKLKLNIKAIQSR